MSKDFLSQDEVDSLLEGVPNADEPAAAGAATAAQAGVHTFDLATQQRIVRGRMPALERINQRFARQLGTGLYNFVRRSAEVVAGPLRVVKYSEFVRTLVPPLNLNLVQVKSLRGTALFVFDSSLISLIVDNMFGGSGQLHARMEGANFTPTELRIIQRLLEIVFRELQKAWDNVHKVEFTCVRTESQLQFVNIGMPNEMVIATTFSIEFGSAGGAFHTCIPYAMLEPIRGALDRLADEDHVEVDKHWAQRLSQQVQSAEVELVVNLGGARLTFEQLLSMKAGDVVALDIPQPMTAEVDSVPVMECRCGVFNGQYALKVEKLLAGPGRDN
jgi:flagellar motor switch protein FliM